MIRHQAITIFILHFHRFYWTVIPANHSLTFMLGEQRAEQVEVYPYGSSKFQGYLTYRILFTNCQCCMFTSYVKSDTVYYFRLITLQYFVRCYLRLCQVEQLTRLRIIKHTNNKCMHIKRRPVSCNCINLSLVQQIHLHCLIQKYQCTLLPLVSINVCYVLWDQLWFPDSYCTQFNLIHITHAVHV